MAKKIVKKKSSIKSPGSKPAPIQKPVPVAIKKLAPSYKIFQRCLQHIWRYKKVFAGISLVYFILTLLLVKGLSAQIDITEIRASLGEVLGGGAGQLLTGLTLFGILLGNTADAGNEVGAAYQSMLLVIVSLGIIWALRQTYAQKAITTKEVFYKGLYPLVPFVLVLLVIGLHLIPLALASMLYAIVIQSGLAVNALEQTLWIILFIALTLASLYMVASSVLSVYIVTLPDMTPLKALRSAKELVRARRWSVARKVLFLPFALLLISVLIMLPVILYAAPLAEWLFFVIGTFSLVVVHSYYYALYRELL